MPHVRDAGVDRRARPWWVGLPRRRDGVFQGLSDGAARCTLRRSASSRIDNSSRRWSRRIASNSSTLDRILTDPPAPTTPTRTI